jgi:hypothetical protein
MRDHISIGPTPAEESCQQVGTPSYSSQAARAECQRFIEAIRKVVGEEPDGASLRIKSNPHDFGTYLDVVCYFESDDEEATRYAYRCESDAPSTWEEAEGV